jgi:predicted peptidase
MTIRWILISCLLTLFVGRSVQAQEFRTWESMEYGLIRPEPYDPARSYPLVISLHGDCRSAADKEKPRRQLDTHGFSGSALKENPCFVLIPQATKPWWTGGKKKSLMSEIVAYIDVLEKEFKIDRKRLYLVGYSDGGTAILHALAWYPDTFAAAIPLSGWLADDVPARKMVRSKTAVWWFVGTEDGVAPWDHTKRLIKEYDRAKGNLKVTVIEVNGDHAAPYRVFQEVLKGQSVEGTRLVVNGNACDEATTHPIEWMFKRSL